MTEESKQQLKVEPATSPLTTDSESSPALTESNKKRVMLGSIIGGALFLGLIIAIIVLVSTAGTQYKPTPPKPKPTRQVGNPFVVLSSHENGPHVLRVYLENQRTKFNTTSSPLPGTQPNIRNTSDNNEPVYLTADFKQMDEHLLNLQIREAEWERWEVPKDTRTSDVYASVSKLITSTPLGVTIIGGENKLFEWSFYGKNHDIIPMITTEHCRMQYFDKYIEFEARLQTDYIYGMGERVDTFHLRNDNYSLWNRDLNYELGEDSEPGTYGSHPFFLNRLHDNKNFIGVFMLNSNAMLFSFWHTLNNGTWINYKFVGGIVDLYLIHAADADYILKKYHSLIGRPYLPPVWGMGFQQARRGYTVTEMRAVVKAYQEAKIPIDAIWADVEMMDNYKAFTIDKTTFGDIKEFVHYLHDPHEGIEMKFVAIGNPGLKVEVGYKYYDEAITKRIVILSALHFEQPFEGRTAADKTVWLDFFQYNSLVLLSEGFHDLHELSSFDGIWIQDNEPNQRCDGECKYRTEFKQMEEDEIPNPFHNASEFDYIQFRPTLESLERNTLPMAAYQAGSDMFHKQFNTHNLFSLQSVQYAHDALQGMFEDKRFLLASRSSFPGAGHYSSHWLGDNYATWKSMQATVSGMLNFNMFGIPHVGGCIGGFYGDTDAELLTRWYELGAFSPLMLSYTNSVANRKEAYTLKDNMDAIQRAFHERYQLLHYFYTKMFEAFAWGGAPVHPLFFEFPTDDNAFKPDVVDKTFMWGKQLYVIPALIQGQIRVKAYVPNWRWYDLRTGDLVVDYQENKPGEWIVFEQPIGYITCLVKGGSIIPHQRMSQPSKIMNIEDLKKIPALLVIAPDQTGKAQGSLVVDSEGMRPHPDPLSHTYRHYSFTYMNQIFRINKLAGFDFHEEYEFDYFWELIILDVFGNHHVEYVCMMATDFQRHELQFIKAHESNALIIHDDRNAKMAMFKLESIVWGTVDQHDFCKFTIHVNSEVYSDENRLLTAELATTDPAAYQLKFDLKARLITNEIINMELAMNDAKVYNWIVPDVIDENLRKQSTATKTLQESGFRISPVGSSFYFEYADPEDPHDFIITSKYMPFVYVRNFIHLRLIMNARHMFGLGERVHGFELTDGIYSLWNADQHIEETGLPPSNGMYGSHPFYMIHGHNPHEFMGVLFLTSNPFDVRIRHTGMQMQVDHLFSGGIIDMFIICEGHANQIIQDYYHLIGRPTPLPFWAFGYHQSRGGYQDIDHLKDMIRKFEDKSIPLDGVWMDKDYMKDYRSFTIDTKKFYGLADFIKKEIHDKGRRFIALIDPSVAIDPLFEIYAEAASRGLFLQSSFTKQPLVGVTWPGYSVWFDFLNPAAETYWETLLERFHTEVNFDGIWLDMNEPSNFCDGECPDETHYNYYDFPLDYYDDLYYNPTHRPLERQTISMEAQHYGTEHIREFNLHNMFGYYQAKISQRFFFQKLRKRPMILSSSTFPGIGRYATHWLGDNFSSWHHMEYSIAGVASFNLFGIPFVGADVCGYNGNTTVNLCSRWYQLGAFYPFMRNHNCPTCKEQEPYSNDALASVAKKSIHMRYALARYLYTEYMYTVHHGGMVFYPVLFDFPEDLFLYNIIDVTFMFGHAIRVTPVLEDGKTELTSYFPNHDWYEWGTWKRVVTYNHSAHAGQNITMQCSLQSEKLNMHLKSGTIVPYQDQALEGNLMAIEKVHELPIKLVVSPDYKLHAIGHVYYDKDEILDFRNREHHDYQLKLENRTLTISLLNGSPDWRYDRTDEKLVQIIIVGAEPYKGCTSAKIVDKKGGEHQLKFEYNTGAETILLSPNNENFAIEDVASISWQ